MSTKAYCKTRDASRPGLAIVEVALVLPIFVIIAVSTIDTCRAIYVRQSAKIAAFECARIAIFPGATIENVQAQCDAILSERGFVNYSLNLSTPDFTLLRIGDLLQVTVSIPANANWFSSSWLYRNTKFDEFVVIMKG